MADEVRLPVFPCPQKFTFWDTALLPEGHSWVGSSALSASGRSKAVFLLLACCTQEDPLAWLGKFAIALCTCPAIDSQDATSSMAACWRAPFPRAGSAAPRLRAPFGTNHHTRNRTLAP